MKSHRRWIYFLELDRIPHGSRTLAVHLLGTEDLLKKWKYPKYVQLAGLFHSVLGTKAFKRKVDLGDFDLRKAIGARAYQLVTEYRDFDSRKAKSFSPELRAIHLANVVEQLAVKKTPLSVQEETIIRSALSAAVSEEARRDALSVLKVIREEQIVDFKIYERADSDAFGLCLALLQETGFKVNLAQAKAEKVVRTYEMAFWTAASRSLRSLSDERGAVTGYEIPHAAMHWAMDRIRSNLSGYPEFCILSESLAGATEHYFMVASLKNGSSPQGRAFRKNLAQALLDSGLSRRQATRKISSYLSLTPFSAFKKALVAEFEMTLAAFRLIKRVPRPSDLEVAEAIEKMKKEVPDWYLIRHKYISGFLLYVSFYCGKQSKAGDGVLCRKVLRRIHQARDFKGMVASLLEI